MQYIRVDANEKANQILWYLLFATIFIFEIARLGDLPGLQMDNIVSDYAAARYIHPQIFQESHFREVDNLRLIDTFYHGNLTMLWTLFVCLLTGSTSVLQYRIGIACWVLLIIGCSQYILYKIKIDKIISFMVMLMLVLAQTTVSTVFTNYYTILPGTAFIMLSLIFQYRWIEKESRKSLFISSFFVGFAIYSYFIYFFYFIVFAVSTIVIDRKILKKENIVCDDIFLCCAGMFTGAYGYILGYISIAIGRIQLSENFKILIFLAIGIALVIFDKLLYTISQKEGMLSKKIILAGIAVLSAGISFILPNLNPSFRYWIKVKIADSASMQLSFLERLFRIPHLISEFMRNSHREIQVLGYTTSKLSFLWRNSCFIVTIIWAAWIAYQIYKKKELSLSAKCGVVLSLYQYGYLFLTLFIVSGMRPYHYTTFCFIEYILLGIMLHNLIEAGKTSKWKYKKSVKSAAAIMLFAIIVMNYVNTGILTTHIKLSGGHNYYTNQLTKLADSARSEQSRGVKAFYCFPEWGFYMSFAYLTGNTVPYNHYLSEEYISERINDGYEKFVTAYFLKENKEIYEEAFGKYSKYVEETIWYTLDGEYGFTTLTLDINTYENPH